MTALTLEFHGVRGSVPSPGPNTVRTGGNTACVEVRAGSTRILLDAGTGLRTAGERLAAHLPVDVTLLLSHLHWDHVQGLPFFAPLYVPGNKVRIVAARSGTPLEEALRRQMGAPFFPVPWEQVAGNVELCEVRPGTPFTVGECSARCAKVNHPDPCHAWRIEHGGRAIVYATDTEHYAVTDPWLRRFARGADVLVCDAQYTDEEYRGEKGAARTGWGHSTWAAAAALAKEADVGELVLFHHDPTRTDDQVDEIEQKARAIFPRTRAAREGLVLEAGGRLALAAG